LGQRKKNQKRRDCKLRAQQRRLSEGDSADYEETEPQHNNGTTKQQNYAVRLLFHFRSITENAWFYSFCFSFCPYSMYLVLH